MKTQKQIYEEVKSDARKGLIAQFTGILSALIPVLAILGISLDWLTEEFIDHLYVLLVAIALFAINVYTIYKNHFSGKDARRQNEVLKEKGLK